MFEQMLLPTGSTHQGRNTALALAGEVLVLAIVAFVVPAVFVAQLPKLELASELIAPPLPPPPPPPAPPAAATRPAPAMARVTPRTFVLPQAAPSPIPQQAPLIQDAAPPLLDASAAAGATAGIPGGFPDGVIGGAPGGSIGAPPAPVAQAAPTPAPASAPGQIRVGGEVQAAKLMHEVQPAYPPIARQAHVSGTVELSATIAATGTVKDVRVVSGNPLLTDAAVKAVRQWTYQPTYLNGKAVEVLTEVDVKFTLG